MRFQGVSGKAKGTRYQFLHVIKYVNLFQNEPRDTLLLLLNSAMSSFNVMAVILESQVQVKFCISCREFIYIA